MSIANEFIKKFKDSLKPNLIADSSNENYITYERDKSSSIKQIEWVFKNIANVLILQQRENTKSLKILNGYSVAESCDFIVFFVLNNRLNIAYCEIKTSYSEKNAKKSLSQIECSRLFMGYIFDCYEYFLKDNINRENINFKRYMIYDKKGIPNKNTTYVKDNMILHIKDIEVDKNGKITIQDADTFFGII